MDPLKIAMLISQADALIDNDEVSEKEVGELLAEMYTEAMGGYSKLLHALPQTTSPIANDVLPILNTVVGIINEVSSDEGLQDQMKKRAQLKARSRRVAYEAYRDEDFTRNEAMSLVLQDISNAKVGVSSLSTALNNSGKSSE
ncbi:hypothetical protein OAD26_00585 [bacterium]|nr:hypothetical protein [bacterium]